MPDNHSINYLEIPASNLEACKAFFNTVFGWSFVDYGPEYTCFIGAGIDGGFFKSDLSMNSGSGSALLVLYASALEETQARVEEAGGQIVKPIFSFPGGRRFHFLDPVGNEYAVWSE